MDNKKQVVKVSVVTEKILKGMVTRKYTLVAERRDIDPADFDKFLDSFKQFMDTFHLAQARREKEERREQYLKLKKEFEGEDGRARCVICYENYIEDWGTDLCEECFANLPSEGDE